MDRSAGSRVLAAGLTLVVLAAACNGDDDGAPSTTAATVVVTPTEPLTTSVPVTMPPTTDATPSTTDRTDDTTPTTEPPPSTTAPPPTTDPSDEAVRQAVLDAVVESWRVFNEAKLDPFNDEKVAALGDVRGGQLLIDSTDIIARYRVENQRSITNPDLPATIEPIPETIELDAARISATVTYCRIGSNIFVETEGNPDGSDLVIDDSINAYHETAELVFTDGAWIEVGGFQLERYDGATECPPLS
ncbi:MAG: hypothetical protein QNJ12_00080 [Ilumatobacter sp.]|uniref:hypothetical protein n=1 Tax=Ilumatobacter sp. TaxID=1967498 RepID=UPI00260306CD|nr:hypothetical protein [Ilumatobacter sp.]MDJ0767147.1 hypothetical protein [Ilumatobacter sp.]